MTKIPWGDLFPTRLSILFFVLYILLFVNQGILVTASQSSNSQYDYNVVTVVLMTEVFKLVASVCLYCKENTIYTLLSDIAVNRKVLALYLVPAFLYCVNCRNTIYTLLSDIAHYLLLQFRVVITAILFQVIFKKQLTGKQWFSLVLLTIGCMLKQVNFTKDSHTEVGITEKYGNKSSSFDFSINAVFILLQTLDSWNQIGEAMGTTGEICKKKMVSVLSSNRHEKAKERNSQDTGKASEEIYKSRWFAYEALAFLAGRNKTRKRSHTAIEQAVQEKNMNEGTLSPDNLENEPQHSPSSITRQEPTPKKKRITDQRLDLLKQSFNI
ncbi:Alcohol dehydrogenase transcription factor Myb/SANT-like [Popillia japonica]|uniref:Alcohol dehydrogenase transcription factor Myb/SANT-like n=1 Tax=Popillia japonica TaxID=7064 RepID=A0AAW1HG31_POPJA